MLGETLAEQAGPELLELVEDVRHRAREVTDGEVEPDAVAALLHGIDAGTAVVLARAFSQYFQLANVAEQLHRSRELRALRPADARPLRTVMRRLASEADADEVPTCCPARSCGRCSRPTRPSRRGSRCSRSCAGSSTGWTTACRTGSSARSSTSSGRPTRSARAARPSPTRPATSPGSPSVSASARCPDLLDEFAAEAADAGLTVPDHARPLALGSWVGGDRDGNPNVTPAVTREVLELYADRALRIHCRLVEQLITELSVSTRVMGVSEELRGSLARDRRALPEVYDRFIRLNAHEPYRLKLSYVQERLERTRRRIAAAGPARGEPGLPGRPGLPRRPRRAGPLAARAPRAPGSPRARSPGRSARPARSGCT